jgi:hypothetical protein
MNSLDLSPVGEPQSLSGSCGVQKNILPLPGTEPRPSSLLLYRLSYPGSKYAHLRVSSKEKEWWDVTARTMNGGLSEKCYRAVKRT